MSYKCAVCNKIIEGDTKKYIDHTEEHIVEMIKDKHPEWVHKDGICKQCYDYYKEELKGKS